MNWSSEDQELIDWYLALDASRYPTIPFELTKGLTIQGPQFYENLKKDIQLGPLSPRARYKALQNNLRALKKIVEAPGT